MSSMSGLKLKGLSASDNEFLAEDILISITSAVDHPTFHFISGDFGPLTAGLPATVPLWLAITLRKQQKCTIQIPEWMSAASLEKNVQNERSNDSFEPLPFHFIVIAKLLLNNAKEDIREYDKVASLLQDLENIRMDRVRLGLMNISEQVYRGKKVMSVGLNGISSGEILTVKSFLAESLSMFTRLTTAASAPDDDVIPAVAPLSVPTLPPAAAGPEVTRGSLRRFRK